MTAFNGAKDDTTEKMSFRDLIIILHYRSCLVVSRFYDPKYCTCNDSQFEKKVQVILSE